MDKFYKYMDFIKTNKENKKWIGYTVKEPDCIIKVEKVSIIMDKKETDRACKVFENPSLTVSGKGTILASTLVEEVMKKHIVLSNPTYLKNWKGFA